MLDNEKRDSPLVHLSQKGNHVLNLNRMESCGNLVQKEKLGVARQGPGNLQSFSFCQSKAGRRMLSFFPKVDDLQDFQTILCCPSCPPSPAKVTGDQQVFQT